MDKVAQEEGQLLLEESERLNNDPTVQVPETIDFKCRKIIKRSFSKNKRRGAFTIVRKVGNRVAVLLFACVLLFTFVYATVPEVRRRTLNILLEISDISTTLSFGDEPKSSSENAAYQDVYGYDLTVVPSGYKEFLSDSDDIITRIRYRNDDGSEVHFSVGGSSSLFFNVDTEDVDTVETLVIHGYSGLLTIKDEVVRVAWGDVESEVFVNITAVNVDRDIVIEIANDMKK